MIRVVRAVWDLLRLALFDPAWRMLMGEDERAREWWEDLDRAQWAARARHVMHED